MKTLTDAQVERAKLAYSKRATQGGEASFEDCIRAALATLTDDAGKDVEGCDHPRWAAYYTGANHTHWICDVCDKKVQNLNYSRNIISTSELIPGVLASTFLAW